MLKRWWRASSGEEGQSLVIIAFALIGLLAFLGLIIDGGLAFALRRQLQNASDAAALAGTKELCFLGVDSSAAAEQAVLRQVHAFAEVNGVEDSNGIPDDGVNTNVVAYFVDLNANRLGNPIGTNGGVPEGARGVEARTKGSIFTFFATFAGQRISAVAASAIAICRPGFIGEYALWANSTTCQNTLFVSGSTNLIDGDMHTNKDMLMSGSTNTVTGTFEYVTEYHLGGQNNAFGNIEQVPVGSLTPYQLSDYAPGSPAAQAAQAQGLYFVITGDLEISDPFIYLNGLYFVTRNVKLSGSNLAGTATIVAQGEIDISGSDHTLSPFVDGLLFYSNKEFEQEGKKCNDPVIKVAGSTNIWNGIIYAPNGQVEISGSVNNAINGSVIAYTINLNGSSNTITFAPQFAPSFFHLVE